MCQRIRKCERLSKQRSCLFWSSSPPVFALPLNFNKMYRSHSKKRVSLLFSLGSRPPVFLIWARYIRRSVLDSDRAQGAEKGAHWGGPPLLHGGPLCLYPFRLLGDAHFTSSCSLSCFSDLERGVCACVCVCILKINMKCLLSFEKLVIIVYLVLEQHRD